MSTVQDDLWPDDLSTTEVLSPKEILEAQSTSLQTKTNGLLTADIQETSSDDRRIQRFVVSSPRLDEKLVLFEIHAYQQLAYPVAIVPPDLKLPDFLKAEVYRPGMLEAAPASALGGRWVKNEHVVGSPTELRDGLQKLFSSASVKSLLISMLTKANRSAA